HRGLARWRHRMGQGATLETSASVGYDGPFQIAINPGNAPRLVDVETFSYGLRSVAHLPLRPWLRLEAGLDFEGNMWPLAAPFPRIGPPREGDPGGFGGGGGGPGSSSGLASDDYTLQGNNLAPFLGATLSFLDKRLAVSPQLRLELISDSA